MDKKHCFFGLTEINYNIMDPNIDAGFKYFLLLFPVSSIYFMVCALVYALICVHNMLSNIMQCE